MPETPLGGDAPVSANFLFEVDGVEIGHFVEVTGLEMTVSTQEYLEGGQNQYVHRFPPGGDPLAEPRVPARHGELRRAVPVGRELVG